MIVLTKLSPSCGSVIYNIILTMVPSKLKLVKNMHLSHSNLFPITVREAELDYKVSDRIQFEEDKFWNVFKLNLPERLLCHLQNARVLHFFIDVKQSITLGLPTRILIAVILIASRIILGSSINDVTVLVGGGQLFCDYST